MRTRSQNTEKLFNRGNGSDSESDDEPEIFEIEENEMNDDNNESGPITIELVGESPENSNLQNTLMQLINGSLNQQFDYDFTRFKQSLLKYIMAKFTDRQQSLYRKRIEDGIDEFTDFLENEVALELFAEESPHDTMWKLGLGPEELKKYAPLVQDIRDEIDEENITIQRILESKLPRDQKKLCIQLFDILSSASPNTPEYLTLQKQIHTVIKTAEKTPYSPEELEEFSELEERLNKIVRDEKPLRYRILEADIDDRNKAVIWDKFLQLENLPDESSAAANIREWIEHALKVPFRKKFELKSAPLDRRLIELRRNMDSGFHGMENVKELIIEIMSVRLSADTKLGFCIGLLGNSGVGKTSIAKIIAETFGIPFDVISLGGLVDSSYVEGQHSGWLGAGPGMLTKILQRMKSCRGVILLDEIDKLGETKHGQEVQSALLSMLDPSQHNAYRDRYLDLLEFDISEILFMCTMNSTATMNPALLNRIDVVKIPDYKPEDKNIIIRNFIFPKQIPKIPLQGGELMKINVSIDTARYLTTLSERKNGREGGVRGVENIVKDLLKKLHLVLTHDIESQREMGLRYAMEPPTMPIDLSRELVDKLIEIPKKDQLPYFM